MRVFSRFFVEQKLPGAVASSIISSIFPTSSKASRAVSLLYSGLMKAEKAAEALHHFSYQEWIFEQRNLPKLQLMLGPQERERWFLGVQEINWRDYIHYFFYGIARWLLKEPSGKLRFVELTLSPILLSAHALLLAALRF